MGMTNKGLKTKINRGEFSEFAFAINLISRQMGLSCADVYERMRVEKNFVTLDGPIKFYGDKKMVPAYEEYGFLLKNGGTDISRAVDDDCAQMVQKVDFGSFDEVKCCGATGEKDDLTILENGVRVTGVSLKYGHGFPERLQSPKWKTILKTYETFGVDLTPLTSNYTEQAKSFLKPALRYSNKKGDYSPQLHENGNKLLSAFDEVFTYLATKVCDKEVNIEALAQRVIGTILGSYDHIHFVELESQSSKNFSRHSSEMLKEFLTVAEFTFEKAVQTRVGRADFLSKPMAVTSLSSVLRPAPTQLKVGRT
jgi:hypothetical protein